jgi:hypothetical protein
MGSSLATQTSFRRYFIPLRPGKINPETARFWPAGGDAPGGEKTRWTIGFQPVKSTSCMKSNLLRTFFEWALITSVLMSIGFFGWYYSESRAVRICNSQLATAQAGYQNNHAVMGVLLGECREYAKTNADMARLLEGGRPAAPAAPGALKPRAK